MQPFKFQGAYLDTETGLYKMGERYYAPSIGRFLQPDPLPGNIMNPSTWDPYAFAGCDGVNHTDPTGMFKFTLRGSSCGLAVASFAFSGARDLGLALLAIATVTTAPVTAPVAAVVATVGILGSAATGPLSIASAVASAESKADRLYQVGMGGFGLSAGLGQVPVVGTVFAAWGIYTSCW